MKKGEVILIYIGLFILSCSARCFAAQIEWEDIARGNLNLETVLIDPENPKIIYLGSRSGVSRSDDGGLNWRSILSLSGQNKAVNLLLFSPKERNAVYAATASGLFYSSTSGLKWNRIYKGKNSWENECTTLAVLPYGIYLGTKEGLFVSKDKGRSWHRESGEIGKASILAIAYNLKEPVYIYTASIKGIFKTEDAGKNWKRIFVSYAQENGNDIEERNEGQDEEEQFSDIRYISCDPNNSNYLYLACNEGVYQSKDRGKSWEQLTTYGLLNRDTKFLLVSKESDIYAVSKSGIFQYKNERWQELSFNLAGGEIKSLALDNQGDLYVACERGLFKANIGHSILNSQDRLIRVYYKDEPEINEVQRVAIKYAEVGAEKIKQWRKQAAKKALLPQVSVGIDRNTTDLWHWEGGSTTKSDDDTLRRGRDSVDWDVTLSWDLGEIIWNSDQTSIDVRSRLTAQLRDDILDEVTKLYFERLRVKMELDNLSIEERKKRCEKEFRIEELTAMLDGLTGGYFTERLKNKEQDSSADKT